MKRLKGPEIKMPELRMPRFLVDLYYDLDDRHLLPLVILLVIGVIAVPFLLSDSGESGESAGEEAVPTPSKAVGAEQSSLVVVREDPRLRDFKRRLRHLSPTDPFKAPTAQGSGAESSSAAAPETLEEATTTESSSTIETTESSGGGGEPTVSEPSQSTIKYFTYAIDVKVTPVSGAEGKAGDAKPEVRHELPPLVMLPSRETPALTYMGPSRDGKKAIMLVSNDVTALFGDSTCVVGGESCQLLALAPGLPETVVFGPKERTFRITLQKIEVQFTDHLERAPLGNRDKSKPKPKSHAG